MSYLPPEQLLRFCYNLLQTDSTSVTSFCQLEYFDNIPVFSHRFFIEPTIFHHFSAFLTNWIGFYSHFFFCMRPAWNTFPCLVSFFLFCFCFTFCPFCPLFRKYFLRNCDSSFSIFRHALQTFSTFDAFSNFLLTFYFYMIFLSTYG